MRESIVVGVIAVVLFLLWNLATSRIPAIYHPLAINALLVGIAIAILHLVLDGLSSPDITMSAFSMGWFGFGLGVSEHACPAGLTLALGMAILLSLPLAKMLFTSRGPTVYFPDGVILTLMRGFGVNLLVISTILGLLFD